MNNSRSEPVSQPLLHRSPAQRAIAAFTFLMVCLLVSLSAIITKEALHGQAPQPLAELNPAPAGASAAPTLAALASVAPAEPVVEAAEAAEPEAQQQYWPPETRWFNGRPVRPARTIWMTTTAYSPDARSCGKFADGITASLHSVETNNMKLVAADSSVLPLGSMLSIPGYDEGNIVPVLDRGGAIKGNRLDLLYPTHEVALKWGVQRLPVTVWEYADGLPADDFRAIRDSKN